MEIGVNPAARSDEIAALRWKVRETVLALGGYWSPLSAIARLLEEIGEVAELLQGIDVNPDRVAAELSDVLIISLCIADQYCADLTAECPGTYENRPSADIGSAVSLRAAFCDLAQRAGRLGRLVNYLEGDKPPKAGEPVSHVAVEAMNIVAALLHMADSIDQDLFERVSATLDMNSRRDRNRFKPRYDPSTAVALDAFSAVTDKTLCAFARRAKVWGAPDYCDDRDLVWNASRIASALRRFCRVAPSEGLDGFVVRLQAPSQIRSLALFAKTFFHLLSELGRANVDAGLTDPMKGDLRSPTWRFEFAGVPFFISTFAPFYRGDHPRFSWRRDSAFIFLQPEFSFDHHGIHAKNPRRAAIKEAIRLQFSKDSIGYSIPLVEQPIESLKYIKPLEPDDPPIEWWRFATGPDR